MVWFILTTPIHFGFYKKKCNPIGYSVYNSEVLAIMKLFSVSMLTSYF